jgi:Ca2+-binding EF-hand superfamily protein
MSRIRPRDDPRGAPRRVSHDGADARSRGERGASANGTSTKERDATGGRPAPRPIATGPNARRMIVREKTLRECFAKLDDGKRGKIMVEEFLERLRGDPKMTDVMQAATEDFTTGEMLDAVFDSLQRASQSWVSVDEFLALFMMSENETKKRMKKMTKEQATKKTSNKKKDDDVSEKSSLPDSTSNRSAKSSEREKLARNEVTSEPIPETKPELATSTDSRSSMRRKESIPKAAAAPKVQQPVVDADYLKRVFNLIDYDENEEITLVEFLSALHVNPEIGNLLDEGTSAGEDVSQIVSEVFSRMDADQNKSVSFDEFVQYFTARQTANENQALNRLTREEKNALLESADKSRVRSMSAFRRGVRFISKQALKAGLRKSEKERKEENLSYINDVDLLVVKAYLRDVYKLIDYEKRERIVMQEFLDELSENADIAMSLDAGSNITDSAEKTKKMVATVFKAMSIDKKRVVTYSEFVNYFIKITSEQFNAHSPLASGSAVAETRSADENAEIAELVAVLCKCENRSPPPARTKSSAAEVTRAPSRREEYMDGVSFDDDEDLDHDLHLMRSELQGLLVENERLKNAHDALSKSNNMLTLKFNVLSHLYSKQSAEFQALIDATK